MLFWMSEIACSDKRRVVFGRKYIYKVQFKRLTCFHVVGKTGSGGLVT